MTTTSKILHAIEHWHYWLVGGFWMLCGLACMVNIFWRGYLWVQPPWIKAAVGLPYFLLGLGFCLRWRWARWCMVPLMLVTLLVCFDGWLCGAWCGNQQLVRLCLVGFAVIIYSSWFVGWSLVRIFEPFDL